MLEFSKAIQISLLNKSKNVQLYETLSTIKAHLHQKNILKNHQKSPTTKKCQTSQSTSNEKTFPIPKLTQSNQPSPHPPYNSLTSHSLPS